MRKTAQAALPTKYGTFTIIVYKTHDGCEHVVLTKPGNKKQPLLVRIHSQCLTGDTFLSLKCDCREQLHESMKMIQAKGSGLIIYLNQEGRGIGLTNKIKAYRLQEKGLDTVEANEALGFAPDARDYKIAAAILRDLDIGKIILLTNNPGKINQLNEYDITVVKRTPLQVKPNDINKSYLLTKKRKLGHKLKFM